MRISLGLIHVAHLTTQYMDDGCRESIGVEYVIFSTIVLCSVILSVIL